MHERCALSHWHSDEQVFARTHSPPLRGFSRRTMPSTCHPTLHTYATRSDSLSLGHSLATPPPPSEASSMSCISTDPHRLGSTGDMPQPPPSVPAVPFGTTKKGASLAARCEGLIFPRADVRNYNLPERTHPRQSNEAALDLPVHNLPGDPNG